MDANAMRSNFIWDFIDDDIKTGKTARQIRTRFPPEPNGYLHIGHAKAFSIDFLTARRYNGLCNLRFDDTNPEKEDTEYVDAIQEDIRWMGFEWDGGLYYASDYYPQMYDLAMSLIEKDLAFVCELTSEAMREYRGTLTESGKHSPYRDRPIADSLRLFAEMKAGLHPEGRYTLRAKIDMASPNINMRDPIIYRIVYAHHHRTGNDWCIYPMYDYAHPIEDALEGITHSLCSLEFEDHRPLYDWVVVSCGFSENPPRQIEFARLNITETIMSKRYLRRLVEEKIVDGWDDPRMPTLRAMRRRGYTPRAILDFIERAGCAKADSIVDAMLLEHCVREDLGETVPRAMAVLNPLKVTLTNWPEGKSDCITLENHPAHPEMGTHTCTFSGTLFVEREDFMEVPEKKFFRLYPGSEVRLKGAYIIRCNECVKDVDDHVIELLCTVDLDSASGSPGAARKVKGTLHWVNAADAVPFEARLYEPLLLPDGAVPDADKKDFIARLNPKSITRMDNALAEPWLAEAKLGDTFQFLRLGYFSKDKDVGVFNRVVGLRDSYQKEVRP